MKKILFIILTIYEMPVIIVEGIIMGIVSTIKPYSKTYRIIQYIVVEYIVTMLIISTILWINIYIIFIK